MAESHWIYNPFDTFYHDPKTRNTQVVKKRVSEAHLFRPRSEYFLYARRPLSETLLEVPLNKRILWESSAHELASAATLLPLYPIHFADCYPKNASQIIRTKYLGCNLVRGSWYFHANYSKDNATVKYIIREIDLNGIHQRVDKHLASMELITELYILCFIRHQNLQHALFTLCEPTIFRMNIAFFRYLRLIDIAKEFSLLQTYETCTSISYIGTCLLRALSFLHSHNIIHQNVIIENVVVDERGNVQLGEFKDIEFFQSSNAEAREGKGIDIFGLGITILDYVLGGKGLSEFFPGPSYVNGFDSFFEKINRCGFDHVAKSKEEKDRYDLAIIQIQWFRKPRAAMWSFLDETLRPIKNLPSADWLIDNHPLFEFSSDQFKNFRQNFIDKILLETDYKIQPFYNEQKVSNRWQSLNARQIFNTASTKSKHLEGHLPSSEYEAKGPNFASYNQFKTDSTIFVAFILHCDFYIPPPRQEKQLIVGNEFSMFKMLFELLDIQQKKYKIHINSTKNANWDFVNDPGQLYFPWDVFRLRAAIESMLSETGTFMFNKKTGNIEKSRTFVLCNHKSKLSRRIEIQMKATRDDLINFNDIEINEYIKTGRIDL